jgi:hypothetical protein
MFDFLFVGVAIRPVQWVQSADPSRFSCEEVCMV